MERDTHSFYSGFVICPHPYRAAPAQGFREQAKVNRLLSRQVSTALTFLKYPKSSACAIPVHDIIHIRWSTFLSDFYFDIYERHILPACALTPALKFAPN